MGIYIKRYNNSVNLEFEQPFVIDRDDLEKAVNTICGTDIQYITNLFWEGEYINDCYKALCFRNTNGDPIFENSHEDWDDEEELENIKLRNTVIGFLDDYIPENYPYNYILVNVSW